MTTLYLPLIRIDAFEQLTIMVPILERGKVGHNGRLCELVVWQYRIAGICGLLHDGSSREFLVNLQKSGAAYAYALPRLDESFLATSKSPGFFASAASGDEQSAHAISGLSRKTWNPDLEHEDDFLYTRFLMDLFYLGASENDLGVIVGRLEKITEGEDSPRREICRAMLAKNSEQFGEGLEDYILERRETYAEAWDSDEILEEKWATDGQVFVEGIALVKLAKKLGLETQAEYLFIPSLVLNSDVQNPSLDSWRSVSD